MYYECPRPGCWYKLLLEDDESTDHKCPYGGETKLGYTVTMSLVEKVWVLLDEALDALYKINPEDTNAPTDSAELKGVCSGLAEVLAIFMTPFFTSRDDVAREAVARRKARLAGNTEYETAGMGKFKYVFPSDDKYKGKPPDGVLVPADGMPAAPKKRAPRKTTVRKQPQQATIGPFTPLSETDKAGIRGAKGKMRDEELAIIYQCSASQIRKIWES